MQGLFSVYLRNSLQLSIIILFILLISPILAHRYSAKCRYYLWTVVFTALLLPIRANIKLTLPKFLQIAVPQRTMKTVTDVVDNVQAGLDWFQYAALFWIVGSALFLIWHLFSHLSFLFAVRRWSEDVNNTDILRILYNVKDELSFKKNISIKSCVFIETPMMVGLFRPVILFPKTLYSQEELPLILKHELVHMKRKDLWYKVLMIAVLTIHWFNPLIHILVRSVLNLCEISCDEEVLRGVGAKERARYGETILAMVRNGSAYKTALSTNFYSATNGIKERIYAIMDMDNKHFSQVLFFAVLLITVCGITTFSLSPVDIYAVSENKEQQSNEMIMTDIEFNYEDAPTQTDMPNMKKGDLQNQSSSNNSLVPFEIIIIHEDTLVEPSQEHIYDSEQPVLMIVNSY